MSTDSNGGTSVRWIAAAIAALILSSAALTWSLQNMSDGDGTYRFIVLVILIVASLTLSAVIYATLGMASSAEAFGLPPGSVRVILAIGVMILFVVFGAPIVGGSTGQPIPDRPPVAVAPSELAKAIDTHRGQGFYVRVLNYGRPATAQTPQVDAVFETFGRVERRSASDIEFGRQLLTAVITLLASIISFYFGARTTGDMAAVANAAHLNAAAAVDPSLGALVSRLTRDIDGLRATATDAVARLGQARTANPDDARLPQIAAALDQFSASIRGIERDASEGSAALHRAAQATDAAARTEATGVAQGLLNRANVQLETARAQQAALTRALQSL